MKNRIRHALPEDFDDRHGVLIQIAHLPDETNSAPRINRGEARSIISASHLIAHLAFLLWKMVWDRNFWIVEGDVFILLAGDDLFVGSQAIENELHQYLDKFADWRTATLLSNLSTSDDPEALRNANEVIEKTAGGHDALACATAGLVDSELRRVPGRAASAHCGCDSTGLRQIAR